MSEDSPFLNNWLGELQYVERARFISEGKDGVRIILARLQQTRPVHSMVVKLVRYTGVHLGIEGRIAQYISTLCASDSTQRTRELPALGRCYGVVPAMPMSAYPPAVVDAAANGDFWTRDDRYLAILFEHIPDGQNMQATLTKLLSCDIDMRQQITCYIVFVVLVTICNLRRRHPSFRHNDLMLTNIVVGCAATTPTRKIEQFRYWDDDDSEKIVYINNEYNVRVCIVDYGLASIADIPALKNTALQRPHITLLGAGLLPHPHYDAHYFLNTLHAFLTGYLDDELIKPIIKEWLTPEYLGMGFTHAAQYNPHFGRNATYRLSRFLELLQHPPIDAQHAAETMLMPASPLTETDVRAARLKSMLSTNCSDADVDQIFADGNEILFRLAPSRMHSIPQMLQHVYFTSFDCR